MKGEDIIQLVDAIEVGNTDLVHELLHTDVDPVHVVNVTLYNGQTPLAMAIKTNRSL